MLTANSSDDDFTTIPSNIKTLIDLLEDKGVSWGHYQQHLPYSGFEGFSWVNQNTQANDYVRKHNPAIIYDANTESARRLSQVKNFTSFYKDLAANQLPQWMFITPNMTNDGHDTSVTVAGEFTRSFLDPLLNDRNFMKNTLVLVTFDETETYTESNRVFSFLLGDAVPAHLVGTEDTNFYSHYSEIATAEANWHLHTLGRWDVGANVFKMVSQHTGDRLSSWEAATGSNPSVFLNESYAGPVNSGNSSVGYPTPNVHAVVNGRTVLPAIADKWRKVNTPTIYTTGVEIADGMHPPKGYRVSNSDEYAT